VTARQTALAIALVAIGLVVAQDIKPGLDFYHTWQYITALAIAIIVLVTYVLGARKGEDGAVGRRIAIAIVGALGIAVGGLLSGLIGPDTITVSGAPGTVTPVPDIAAAAFFGAADTQTIARGDGTIELRKKSSSAIPVPAHTNVFLGTSIAYLGSKPAAFIVARDARGNHLTVTQPNAAATFLSPVLLFPNAQPIRDKTFPLDTFAVPALHRVVRALYFSAEDAATFNHTGVHAAALVLSVNDDGGKTVGLTIAPSGHEVAVAGLNVTATLGTYPILLVASAPHPAVLIVGFLLFLGGSIAAFSTAKRSQNESARTSPPV